ncbi:MAG TPA: RluA family pseudouridine synthase [Limnochordales bacterium]
MIGARPFLSFVVAADDDGRVLANVLRRRWRMSRGFLRQLKRGPYVLVNGRPVALRETVTAGDRVELCVPSHLASNVLPEPVPLAVVFEDEHVLVLDKPAGVLVHPAHGEQSGTLANGVAYRLAARGQTPVAGPVTRLDRNTSGLVVFAKHPFAHHALAQAHARGELRRSYVAIAEGIVMENEGVIDAPIRRVRGELTRREVAPDGQRAVTRFRVLDRTGVPAACQATALPAPSGAATAVPGLPAHELPRGATLLGLALETGRTHQIRVHLAHLGHPLLGDPLYGRPLPGILERQALHAWRLEFPHPVDGRRLAFVSPLPQDLDHLCQRLNLRLFSSDSGPTFPYR